MQKFITIEEARDAILEHIRPVIVERVFLERASGRVLAETILAPENSPPFDNSAMDGYALRFSDLEGGSQLDVVGEVAAGSTFDRRLGEGEAVRIMTGAPVPEGADTVVMREVCQEEDGRLDVEKLPGSRGANIRRAGSGMTRDEIVLDIGDSIGASEIGLLASFKRSAVAVFRKPVVAIITTGDELVEVDQDRGEGQIINSNAYMLESLVDQAGGVPLVLPIVGDTRAETRQAFEAAIRSADLVVSVGGVSVGDYDFVREVLDDLTGGMNFWKVRMKPGKPLAFGTAEDETPLIGLPGNPVSSFVCFHQFVRPAMGAAQGLQGLDLLPQRVRAKLVSSVSTKPDRRYYISGTFSRDDDELRFEPYPNQSSGNLRGICRIDGFAVIPEGIDTIEAGREVVVELFG